MYIILLTYIYVLLITVIFLILKRNEKNQGEKRYHTPLIRQGEKIPKIIHQIWIGGEMPEYRKVLTSSINDFCREGDVTYILWDNNVLTPGTPQFEYIKPYWGIILKFLKGEKVVWAKVADILRYILLYTFGGCYLDTTFEIVNREKFKDYWEKYDSYDFVGCNETNEREKFLSNAFYMCKKGSVNMRKLLEKLQYINIDGLANETTGPYFFINVLKKNYVLIKTSDIYPFYPWSKDERETFSRCYNNKEGIPISVYGKNLRLEFPCRRYDSVLINHWSGGTWLPSKKNVEEKIVGKSDIEKGKVEGEKNILIFDDELFFGKYNYYFIVEFLIYFLIKGWKLIPYRKVKGNLKTKLRDMGIIRNNLDYKILLFYTSKTIFSPDELNGLRINVIVEDLHFDKDISNLKMIYNSIDKIYSRYPNSIKEVLPFEKVVGFSHYASPLCYQPLRNDKINKLLVIGNTSDIYPLRSFVIKTLPKRVYSIRKFKGYSLDGDSFLEYMDYVSEINRYKLALCDIGIVPNVKTPYILAKIFEIPACNTALLTHRRLIPQLSELGFIENYHYIACDEGDILPKLNYWLSPENWEKLRKITTNGHNFIKENFNIFSIYKKFEDN